MLLKEFIKDHTNSSHNNGTYNDSKSWQIAWSFEEHYNTPWTRKKQMCCLRTLQAGPWNTRVTSYSYTNVRENRKEKNVIQYAVLEFIDSITVLYGQGLACSSCTFQSTRAAGKAKISPIKTLQQACLRCNHHSRSSCLRIFSQKFWPPCNYFAQDTVLFFKKTKASLRQCKNISMVLSMVL